MPSTEAKQKAVPNKKQQECIDNLEGKYLVLAGPGTGKTFTVIKRLENMLKQGIKAERILCLTYSVAAAVEMKKRVLKELNQGDSNIEIHTYHAFCNKIISENSEMFELPENFRIIPDIVKQTYIEECIDEIQDVTIYKSTKANPYTYAGKILERIEELKKHRIFSKKQLDDYIEYDPMWRPEIKRLQYERDNNPRPRVKYESHIQKIEEKIARLYELWKYFELYKRKTEMAGYIDFDDMINFILEKFETSPTFLEQIANNYDYILLDEFQDTNPSQNELIFKLIKNSKTQNIFAVGDDEQIVYASQGASNDNMKNFLREFPDTKVICLTENRRSTQTILDFARIIADYNTSRLEKEDEFKKFDISKKLTSVNKAPENKVRLNTYCDYNFQYSSIASEIDELINSSDCPKDKEGKKDLSQIAIIMTNYDELRAISKELYARNIPYEEKVGKNIFEIKSSVVLFYYLQTLINPELNSDKLFKLLLMPPFNIESDSYIKLYSRDVNDKTFIDTARRINSPKLKEFLKIYDELTELKAGENVYKVVLQCASKTGIIDYYFNNETNRIENILGIKKILDEAYDFSLMNKKINLEEFVENLEIAYEQNMPITVDKGPVTLNAVQLTTYQSSKGHEYEYVYLPSLQAKKWESNSFPVLKPSVPLSPSERRCEEEYENLKLADRINKLFVGITRAKRVLRLSYVNEGGAVHTKYINEAIIPENLIEKNIYEITSQEEYANNIAKSIVVRDYDYKRDFKELINAKLNGLYYSPTIINEYIKCPRLFFYNEILELYPMHGISDSANYGIAVHETLRKVVNYAKENGNFFSLEDLIQVFSKLINSIPFSSIQIRNHLKEKGIVQLGSYFEQYLAKKEIKTFYETEKNIISNFENVEFKGKIDRIDIDKNGDFIIIDYKTGKPKNENMICFDGENQDYYIQMGLYKYFLEKETGKKVSKTTFVFPEENKTLDITYDDKTTAKIIEMYRTAIRGIQNHHFEPNCNELSCKYCPYKNDICKMEIV